VRRGIGAVVLPALAAAGLTGCADDGPNSAITNAPLCETGDDASASNAVVLMAQSVPSATWVPCIRAALPLGWNFHHLEASNGLAKFWLDSDRDGVKAVEVRLTETCSTHGATEIPSDREGMRRLERVGSTDPSYSGERYYLFDGGCLTVVFSLDGDSAGEGLALASQVVGVVSRADLRDQVRAESGGRLHLDPPDGAP
jgi:hypothetical protein